MNSAEANALITLHCTVDPRSKPDLDKADQWARILHDVTLAEAEAALLEFERTRADWLLPAHIMELVRLQRRRAADAHRRQLQLERAAAPKQQGSTQPPCPEHPDQGLLTCSICWPVFTRHTGGL